MGFFIGIGGVLTFKNARVSKEVASEIPLSSIVLETGQVHIWARCCRIAENVIIQCI